MKSAPPPIVHKTLRRQTVLVGCFLFLHMLGCPPPVSDSERAARQFVEAYYVRIDLEKTRKVAEGLALSRIDDQQRLRQGETIQPGTHQPKVSYELLSTESVGPEEINFLFMLSIQPDQSEGFKKISRLKTRLREGEWKVSQFSEHSS